MIKEDDTEAGERFDVPQGCWNGYRNLIDMDDNKYLYLVTSHTCVDESWDDDDIWKFMNLISRVLNFISNYNYP